MSAVLHNFPSLASLQDALAQGKISATELAQDCLKQIQAQHVLNAFVHVDEALTLAQARAADASRAAGTAGP